MVPKLYLKWRRASMLLLSFMYTNYIIEQSEIECYPSKNVGYSCWSLNVNDSCFLQISRVVARVSPLNITSPLISVECFQATIFTIISLETCLFNMHWMSFRNRKRKHKTGGGGNEWELEGKSQQDFKAVTKPIECHFLKLERCHSSMEDVCSAFRWYWVQWLAFPAKNSLVYQVLSKISAGNPLPIREGNTG